MNKLNYQELKSKYEDGILDYKEFNKLRKNKNIIIVNDSQIIDLYYERYKIHDKNNYIENFELYYNLKELLKEC